MSKIQKIIAALFFYAFATSANAQQTYALLIGINNYYDQPGHVYSQLHGCVNDAKSIKGLLIDRFGFNENNITSLYDEQATKANVVADCMQILNKCKPGDAFVFYYSGHGVWISNSAPSVIADSIKQGMNQSMVMSDLYEDNLGCLLTDAIIKKILNAFIDKKVIVTSFFDCCYSGNISMDNSVQIHNAYIFPPAFTFVKSLDLSDLYSQFSANLEHTNVDSFQTTLAHHLFTLNAIDSLNKNDSLSNKTNNLTSKSLERSFNLKDAIKINDGIFIQRPSDRKNSRFISFSASSDEEKALEIMDETGTYHGAFTKALLNVMKHTSSIASLQTIITELNTQMPYQSYPQTFYYHFDSTRLKGNILGISNAHFKDSIWLFCGLPKNDTIIVFAGKYQGINVGNTIVDGVNKKVEIQIIKAGENESVGKVLNKNESLINIHDTFFLSGNFTISAPLIKIYLRPTNLSSKAFQSLMEHKIIPLSKLENYRDYTNFDNVPDMRNIFFDAPKTNPDSVLRNYMESKSTVPVFAFLPVPSNIEMALKKVFQKNQNIQLVTSEKDADFVLSLNYTKAVNGTKSSFAFMFTLPVGPEINIHAPLTFFKPCTFVSSLDDSGKNLASLSNEVNESVSQLIRYKSEQWLNDDLRK